MKYIFSHEGLQALTGLVAGDSLYALDFDGTLASIVPQPRLAAMAPEVALQLDRLAQCAPVAIVSGRQRADLLQRVPRSVSYVFGNHGNEGLPAQLLDESRSLAICAGWQQQIGACLDADRRLARVTVEDKGSTLSVHYRHMQHPLETAPLLAAILAALHPAPRLVRSPFAFNLLPQGAAAKDDAVNFLARNCGSGTLLYVGDDETDEEVFEQALPHWVTVRVGERRPSAARFYLRYQAQIRDLLLQLNRMRRTLDLRG